MPEPLQILSAAHLVVAALTSLHTILMHPQARGAALWLGIIWLVPWVGPLLYMAIGVNRVPRRARAMGDMAPVKSPVSRPGNHVAPLIGGDAAYAEMIRAIDGAQQYVHLVTYIFDNDRAGNMFAQALGRAVTRGVRVRVLVDAVGARYSSPSIVKRLRKEGVVAERFLPTAMPWRWHYANLRNHRKLMAVDGAHGFIGGMNIREGCMASLMPAEPTLDVHFRVDGPVVEDLSALFAADWWFATGEALPVLDAPPSPGDGPIAARLVHGGPDRSDEPIRWLKLSSVVRATRRVLIVTPYFVPDEDVVSALCAAASAGVQIRIVLPSVNNLRLIAWASRACWPRLLDRGIEIVLSPPPFEHTKLMLIDDDVAIVGSANWDERSFRLNFEADLVCHGSELVAALDEAVGQRLKGAHEVTLGELAACSMPSRLRDHAARLALPYL